MNISQAIVIIFMTALLFIVLAIVVTNLSEELKDVNNIKFCLLSIIMLIWAFIIFVGDLYMIIYKVKDDLKNYQKQLHEDTMLKYIEGQNSCPNSRSA